MQRTDKDMELARLSLSGHANWTVIMPQLFSVDVLEQ